VLSTVRLTDVRRKETKPLHNVFFVGFSTIDVIENCCLATGDYVRDSLKRLAVRAARLDTCLKVPLIALDRYLKTDIAICSNVLAKSICTPNSLNFRCPHLLPSRVPMVSSITVDVMLSLLKSRSSDPCHFL
jgi:hypothetical protein